MTTADYIADYLSKKGIRYVFGLPGGASLPYIEALRNAGIEFILTSNEATAGIMADVTGRLTGIPGICHATFGPGATNITTGVGSALLDRSPVIVFTSEMDDIMIGRTTQMNIDHQKLFAPLTKATFRMNEKNASEVLSNAFRICSKPYPGPVHIGLPSDLHNKEIIEESVSEGISELISYHNNTGRIIELLENSRRPLMVVGLTAVREGLQKKILQFLEKYRMPVILTPMAKGIIPNDHPCYTGIIFHALSDYLEDIYDKCDLILGIGYDPVEFNYESWIPECPLIHFDIKETDIPLNDRCLQFVGETDKWFGILNNLNAGSLAFEGRVINTIRDEIAAVFEGFTNHFGPVTALKILREELPESAIVTSDVGSHLHLIGQFWDVRPEGKLIMTNGWSSMGFGIPAALAAQLNYPGSTVACVTGDGGFLMMAGELITARRYNLPVIIVVFSDGELNLIRLKQNWKDLPVYGTVLYQSDLFGSDTFFGVNVLKAGSAEEMRKAVNIALSLYQPVIINAVIDPDDYKWLVVKR